MCIAGEQPHLTHCGVSVLSPVPLIDGNSLSHLSWCVGVHCGCAADHVHWFSRPMWNLIQCTRTNCCGVSYNNNHK